MNPASSDAQAALQRGANVSSAQLADFLKAIDRKADAFISVDKLNSALRHKEGKGALKDYQYFSTTLPPDPKGANPVCLSVQAVCEFNATPLDVRALATAVIH